MQLPVLVRELDAVARLIGLVVVAHYAGRLVSFAARRFGWSLGLSVLALLALYCVVAWVLLYGLR